jgi:predicted membrane-bound spermidine synthase
MIKRRIKNPTYLPRKEMFGEISVKIVYIVCQVEKVQKKDIFTVLKNLRAIIGQLVKNVFCLRMRVIKK